MLLVMPTVQKQDSAVTRPATSTTSAQILGASANRNGMIIVNDSAAILYVLFKAGTASSTNYTVQLAANAATYEHVYGSSGYSGPVNAVLASGTGSAQVTVW